MPSNAAERTLRSWRLTDDELASVHREARDIQQQAGKHDKTLAKSWAETEVRSPIDGMIVEKNFNVGDIVANFARPVQDRRHEPRAWSWPTPTKKTWP